METCTYTLSVDPFDFLRLLYREPGFFLLDSSLRQPVRGRYSYVGYDPFLKIEGNDLKAFANLQKSYHKFFRLKRNAQTPFAAGLVGYISYDFGLQFEQNKSPQRMTNVPGFSFGFYDCVITVDHYQKKLFISSSGDPEKNFVARQKRARFRLESIKKVIASLPKHNSKRIKSSAQRMKFKSNFSRSGYCNAVKKALDYIKRGDIYQVNLAQEFLCTFARPVNTVSLYQELRKRSPSCFSGFLDMGTQQIVTSSPEMFLRLQNGLVETRPMKGTRPRGKTVQQDLDYYSALRTNLKEKAELLMVTDLERNDLGRACDFGSVRVKKLREIEKYRTVFQATSTVLGKLAKNKDGFDLLKACFPSGSVTGCPKIRAMQIIKELEPTARGIYTGALGYISFNGDMAFNVLIRTLLVQKEKVSFHVGSGIVADSRPQEEYLETLTKALALQASLKNAQQEK